MKHKLSDYREVAAELAKQESSSVEGRCISELCDEVERLSPVEPVNSVEEAKPSEAILKPSRKDLLAVVRELRGALNGALTFLDRRDNRLFSYAVRPSDVAAFRAALARFESLGIEEGE